jgi:hypothetical protein
MSFWGWWWYILAQEDTPNSHKIFGPRALHIYATARKRTGWMGILEKNVYKEIHLRTAPVLMKIKPWKEQIEP